MLYTLNLGVSIYNRVYQIMSRQRLTSTKLPEDTQGEIVVFWMKSHWRLFLRTKLTKTQHCFGLWHGAEQARNQYLNSDGIVYLRNIFASLGLDGFNVATVRPICVTRSGAVGDRRMVLKRGAQLDFSSSYAVLRSGRTESHTPLNYA